MDIHLGTAAYDIRFERQKAAQDIAGIEAEWNAALDRIRSKASGIIGFGGGGGGGGSHNGAVAGGGQPTSQVAANGNGVSRAAVAVSGAAIQNDMLAAAVKNPLMRAAYFSANQAVIAPSMAAQLGVTTQQLANAMTGSGGGASIATRSVTAARAQMQFYSAQGDRPPTGAEYNIDALDDAIPEQMRQTQKIRSLRPDRPSMGGGSGLGRNGSQEIAPRPLSKTELEDRQYRAERQQEQRAQMEMMRQRPDPISNSGYRGTRPDSPIGDREPGQFKTTLGTLLPEANLMQSAKDLAPKSNESPYVAFIKKAVTRAGALAAAAFGAGLLEEAERNRQEIFNSGGDTLKRQLLARPGKQIENMLGAVPLIGNYLQGASSFFTGSEDRRIMGNISTREAEASAVIRRRQTAQISNEASLAFMGGSPSYSALLSVGPETQLEIASLNEQRRRASLGAKTDAERGIINRSFGDQINAVSAFGDTREASARFGMFREGSFSRMNQRALGKLAEMRPAAAHAGLIREQGAFDLISGTAAIEGDLDKRLRAEQAKATPDVDKIRQMHADANQARSNLLDRARERVGELTVGRLDVLKNIYGGRPEEIGGFQSVEARRDISPETNQAAFEAYTKAIEALTDEIRRLNGGKN